MDLTRYFDVVSRKFSPGIMRGIMVSQKAKIDYTSRGVVFFLRYELHYYR
jgi:hypothetical protein